MLLRFPCVVTIVLLWSDTACCYDYTDVSCHFLRPQGIGAHAQESVSPFTVKVTPAVYRSGEKVRVEVSDPSGQLLFQSAMFRITCNQCGKRGTLSSVPTTPGRMVSCHSDQQIAIATRTKTLKSAFTAYWTPNFTHTKRVYIMASVVYNNSVWWRGMSSEDLKLFVDPSQKTTSHPPPTATSPPPPITTSPPPPITSQLSPAITSQHPQILSEPSQITPKTVSATEITGTSVEPGGAVNVPETTTARQRVTEERTCSSGHSSVSGIAMFLSLTAFVC